MPPDAWADLKERIGAQLRERSNVVRGSAYLTHIPELVAEIETLRTAIGAQDPPPRLGWPGQSFGADGHAVGRDLEFTCPTCGGHTWGTEDTTHADPAKWIGMCHAATRVDGQGGHGACGFKWERGDDARYFAPRDTR
jgi:hypothetical protein